MNKPDFSYERSLAKRGYTLIIGVDEVGRGAFAGPVVASAVVFKTIQNSELIIQNCGIDDSKRLRPKERQILAKIIKDNAIQFAVAEVGVGTINRIGIGKATEKAMRKAVLRVMLNSPALPRGRFQHPMEIPKQVRDDREVRPFLLVDAFYVKYVTGIGLKHQKAIVKGDQKSISIAAASILAKVYRDRLMKRLGKKYKRYNWGKNKGYGTSDHQQAIKKFGITKYHRRVFVETWKKKLLTLS